MDSLTRATFSGVILAVAALGVALAVTPPNVASDTKWVVLATGDVWGEVEPCG